MNKETLTNGQRVFVSVPTGNGNAIEGYGYVIGLSAEYPVVGKIYIVNMDKDSGIPNETYPWSAFCTAENTIQACEERPNKSPVKRPAPPKMVR